MVGEPTTFTKGWFDAFPDAADATPLLAAARGLKTEQEVERLRLANEIAAAAMDHVLGVIRPGQTEAQIASEWLGFVHGEGTGWGGKVELALGFSLVWAGPGIKTFTATTSRPVVDGRADALRDLGLCRRLLGDHTKNVVVGELTPATSELEAGFSEVYDDAVAFCVPGAGLAELDRRVRDGVERMGYPVRPRTRSATASALGPTSRHTRIRPEVGRWPPGWCLQSSQDATGRKVRGTTARGQLPDHRRRRRRLQPVPGSGTLQA